MAEADNIADDDEFERRVSDRTNCYRGAFLVVPGQKEAFSCSLRDASEHGASIRLHQKVALLPLDFLISDNALQITRRCQLIWRESDFVGLMFVD